MRGWKQGMCFGRARKSRLFWFIIWRRNPRHLFVSGSWYCQIKTTRLIMFFSLSFILISSWLHFCRIVEDAHKKKYVSFVVGPLRFYPPYTNDLVVFWLVVMGGGGFTLPTLLLVRPLKKNTFFYLCLPLRVVDYSKKVWPWRD